MNAKKDLNYAFALSRRWLWLLGVWPDPNASVSNFHRLNMRFIIVMCILSFYVIMPQLRNIICAGGNIGRIVECIASVNFSFMALSKLYVTWYHNETLRTLMTSVLTDWMTSRNSRERNTMLKFAKSGRNLSFQCYIYGTILFMFYILLNLQRMYQNIMLQQQQRKLVYHFNYPYNVQKRPNYEITYLIQISGGTYLAVINCSVDSFILILLLHMCAQLINLRVALNDLVNDLANHSISSSKFKECLAAIAMRHEHIIRNVKMINDCYSTVLLIYVLTATFQICFETFQVFTIITDHLEISALKMFFLLSYATFVIMQLYLYCHSAEKLLTESVGMAYGAYECKWYELSPNDAKNLMFIVYRSKIPLQLTAGKFGTFSMEMFIMTMKTAMGYLSAMLAMRN